MKFLLIFSVFFATVFVPPGISSAEAGLSKEGEILNSLAAPAEICETGYGAGPLLSPQKTYYLSVQGNDGSDGLTIETAWRTFRHAVSRLDPGDTLLVKEGEYNEPGLRINRSGKPGKPIVIAAFPGHRVLFTGGARPGPIKKTAGRNNTYEIDHKLPVLTRGLTPGPFDPYLQNAGIWQEPAAIKLEPAGSLDRVDELPGTFHYDEIAGKLYVHFSDSRGPETHGIVASTKRIRGRNDIYFEQGRAAVELTGSYVHLKGINFRFGFAALAVFDGHNNTIEECSFFATDLAGLVLWKNARGNLIKNNYAFRNGLRGSVLIDETSAERNMVSDNLIKGNLIETSASTLRTSGVLVHSAIRTYGWPGPRNHIIENVMDERAAQSCFLWRGASPESVFQGNVLTSGFSAINWYPEIDEEKAERIIVRNNTILGRAGISRFTGLPSEIAGNWATRDIAFLNNIVLNNNVAETAAAGFADPAYLDYRIVPESPFAGQALGGVNLGAYPFEKGRIFYVSKDGSDTYRGLSPQNAFGSFSHSTPKLMPGDTLYIMEGEYEEKLAVSVSGTVNEPIKIRAHGRKDVTLPGIIVEGGHIEMEGMTVKDSDGDGITVKGGNIALRNIFTHNNKGAGIKAVGAFNLHVYNSTLAGNETGIVLTGGSAEASVRDNIFAYNEKHLDISRDSTEGFRASHNAYHIPGMEKHEAETEWSGIKGDMLFVDAQKGSFTIWQDSPAANAGIFSGHAGAFKAKARPPEIFGIEKVNIRDISASVLWNTKEDTSCTLHYRPEGTTDWLSSRTGQQGTVHGIGLDGLEPGKNYEFMIEAEGRRGGASKSEIHLFRTESMPLAPATFHVKPEGNDKADGLSPQTAWKTIRKANAHAGPGDTVKIMAGTYIDPISPLTGGTTEKRITYKKYGEGEVFIDGAGAMIPLLSLVSKGYVTVDNFIFINPIDIMNNVIHIIDSPETMVLNCRVGYRHMINATYLNAVRINNSPGSVFQGNTVWGTRSQFSAHNNPGLIIKNNTFIQRQYMGLQIGGIRRGQEPVHIINNIMYSFSASRNPYLTLTFQGEITDTEYREAVVSDYNLFYPAQGNIAVMNLPGRTISGANLEDWQSASELDSNSIEKDPLFSAGTEGDFRLLHGSPALGSGLGGKNIGAH